MKILIVDDEEGICKQLKHELQKEGFTVEYRISPLNVLEDSKRAKEDGEPYNLLLLDIRMPGMDGFKLLEEIKKAQPNLDVIIITGYGDEEKAIKAIRLGAFDYLNKPISLKELHTSIFRINQKIEREEKKPFRHRVLVVDDEKDLCDHIKHELDKEGYLVTAAYDGEEGLDYFKNNRVDIVIADLKMPRMSGLEMLKHCREITDNFISIIITGHGDHETAIKALRMGVFNYLKKPIPLEELIISVDKGTDLLLLQRGLSARKRELEIETAIKKQYADNLEKIAKERTKEIKKLSDAVKATTEGIIVTDLEAKITDLNKAALKMYGTGNKEGLVGKSAFDLIVPEERVKALTGMKEVMEKGYVKDREYHIAIKGGTKIPVEMSVSIMEGMDGEPIGFVGIVRDITDRKQAEEKLQQSYKKLQKTMEGTINTIAKIIETRDPYTAGHQQRVSKLSTIIAREMKLPQDKIEGIRITSLFHDVGKIGLPVEILSKPTKLSKIEYSLIKGHSQVGHDILKTIDFPWQVAQIILQHHERVDGSGYPQGLKGNEILIESKIIAVADVVEAMSFHRPYRPALGIDKALEEISQNKGILYDLKVADTCLKLFREKKFKF
ncbi:histidine kinase [Candidatus Atribacteria bacterium HGW-Atribacteria-1]|nr:MAG: histidine kinase [Candidatus Atribacteria bacterium HGW-Atribacteria-1]